MTVHAERMRGNLELTHGALFSQRVLLALVEGGMARDEAYRIVQSLAGAHGTRERRCATCSPPSRPPPELDLDALFRLRLVHAPRRRDLRAARRDRLAVDSQEVAGR